jgi:hypothetical protein
MRLTPVLVTGALLVAVAAPASASASGHAKQTKSSCKNITAETYHFSDIRATGLTCLATDERLNVYAEVGGGAGPDLGYTCRATSAGQRTYDLRCAYGAKNYTAKYVHG